MNDETSPSFYSILAHHSILNMVGFVKLFVELSTNLEDELIRAL